MLDAWLSIAPLPPARTRARDVILIVQITTKWAMPAEAMMTAATGGGKSDAANFVGQM